MRAARILQKDISKEVLEAMAAARETFKKQCGCLVEGLEMLSKSADCILEGQRFMLKSVIVEVCRLFPNRFYSASFIELFLNSA